MSSTPHTVYTPRPNTVPEGGVASLASVYRFILDCHAKKKAARPGGPDDAEESKNDRTAEFKYNR